MSKFFLFVGCVQALFATAALATHSIAQELETTYVSSDWDLLKLEEAFADIQQQTDFYFTYNFEVIKNIRISNEQDQVPLVSLLKYLAGQTNLKFLIQEEIIYVTVDDMAGNSSGKKLDLQVPALSELKAFEALPSTKVIYRLQGIDHEVDRVIRGRVTSEAGEPLVGATVRVKGMDRGTITDADGSFSIAVPEEGEVTLMVSYIGYETQMVPLEGRTELAIQLKPKAAELDEAVVIGYGSINKSDKTAASVGIQNKEFKNIPVTSIEQALAGQLAGVEITQNSGQPGQANSINIRGVSSITAGTSPLIVLDGMPLSESTSLNSINPNDIASIQVLKDAASASIYGSRGANGVILITTKKGRGGKPQFSYNSFIGNQSIAKKLEFVDAYEQAQLSRDARNNYYLQFDDGTFSINDPNEVREANAETFGFNRRKAIIPSYMQPYLEGQTGLTNTDWQDELFRNALIQSHQLSVRGGDEDLSYFISGGFFDQEGIVLGTDFTRYSVRANIEARLSDKFTYGLNLSPSVQNENVVEDDFSNGPMNGILMALPYFPAYNEDGSLAISEQVVAATEGDQARAENPVAQALENQDKRRTILLQGGSFLQYEIIEGLKAKTYFGVDLSNNLREVYRPTYVGRRNNPAPVNAYGYTSNSERINWVSENTLTYDFSIDNAHFFNVLAGFTYQREERDFSSLDAQDFPNDFVTTLNAGQIRSGTSTSSEWSLVSYLARVMYEFDNKYYLTAALRTDGSSRFGENNKYGTFPSLSLGYRISNENFFPSSGILTDLKLRASWGITGNNQIGDFSSLALLTDDNYIIDGQIVNGLAAGSSPNANLGWEQTTTYDIGLDVGFWDDRLSASIDYYVATTEDLLLQVPVPAHSGFTSSLQNIGRLENRGFELALRANYNLGQVKATTSFNFSTNQNEVLELGPGQEEIISGGRAITRIGGELGASYGYRTLGVFTSEEQIANTPSLPNAQVGEYIYEDINGDGEISSDDRVVLGSIFPDYSYGINQNFNFKNFDLGIIIQSVQGVHIHNRSVSVMLYNPEGWGISAKDYFDNYYTPERGESAIYARPNSVPRDNGFYRETDVLQEDASYFRIRNITFGYTFPADLVNSVGISNLRVYVSSKNPFTFTDFRGWNPEQQVDNNLNPNANWSNYPLERSVVFGLNLDF